MSASKKRRGFTLDDKLKFIQEVENHPKDSRAVVAERLGLPLSTLKTIYGNRQEIRQQIAKAGSSGVSFLRKREGKFAPLETALFEWFRQQRDATPPIPISGSILQGKAKEIAERMNISDFKASIGWLDNFKKRFDIHGRTISGEADSVSNETVDHWLNFTLPDTTKNYALKDIYNVDETGLFYNLLPNKTLAEKGDSCRDGKRSKQRLSVLLGANADGSDKLPPLVIGRSKKPRCFKGVQTLPTLYEANKKAWMTGALFEDYLHRLDSRLRRENRHILMFVDNCSAHPKNLHFTNITLAFFPPNCTSRIQMMDLGIIAKFKSHYKTLLVHEAIAVLGATTSTNAADRGNHQIGVLKAMHFISAAWDSVKPDTIMKCFRKCGISEEAAEYSDDDESDDATGERQQAPRLETPATPPGWSRISEGMDFQDFVRFDDDVAVSGLTSLEEMISNAVGQESDEEDDANIPPPDPPSFAEALSGYEAAKAYLCSKDISEEEVRAVSVFGRILYQTHFANQQQPTIDTFFKS